MMNQIYEKLVKCADAVKSKIKFQPKVALILGSGLGDYAETMQVEETMEYTEIEGFPVSTVAGHKGRFLFGYVEGSFTGAKKGGSSGLFEAAHKGTLFLDEIGDAPLPFQVKLLRVLQERQIRRVGSIKIIPIDVRVIVATNHNLKEHIKAGLMREDLYYRLNVIPLYLPPLRERKEDIRLLANYLFQSTVNNINTSIKSISQEAFEKLTNYDYPGNVRELSNIIERAINVAQGSQITAEDIILFNQMQNTSCAHDLNEYSTLNLDEALRRTEKNILQQAMKKFSSSRKLGAAIGLSHTSVIRKMKEHNLSFDKNN